jgi:hypothetical protein
VSDTPETDAFIDSLNDDWDYEFAALTSHARKLERERNVLRGALIYIAGLDTSQEANPQQCSAAAVAKLVLEDLTHR